MERTRGSGEREKERERARGVIATLRVQDREELKRGGVKKGVCGEHWLI